MTDTRTAMTLALEALEVINNLDADINFLNTNAQEELVDNAIDSLKAALAAQGEKREARKPLTTEQIYTMYSEPSSDAEMVAFAREVEKAHGIVPNNDHKILFGVCESLDVAKDGVQAQVDAAFEARRQRFVKLPKYSFLLSDGGVRRVEDRCGNWVEFSEAHSLFEPPEVATHPDPRIKELESEVERLKSEYEDSMRHQNNAYKQRVAERDAALVDARRYRWLCEFKEWPDAVDAAFDCSPKFLIDDAIDAAMKGDQ